MVKFEFIDQLSLLCIFQHFVQIAVPYIYISVAPSHIFYAYIFAIPLSLAAYVVQKTAIFIKQIYSYCRFLVYDHKLTLVRLQQFVYTAYQARICGLQRYVTDGIR